MAGDQETCGYWPPSDPSFSLRGTPAEWGQGGREKAGEISAQRGWSENPRENGQGRIDLDMFGKDVFVGVVSLFFF